MPAPRICVFTALTYALNPANPGRGKPWARLLAQNLLAAAAYWGSAVLVRWYFAQYQMWPAPIWLPAGIALFAALAIGRWSWPGIFVGALLTDSISFGQAPGPAAMLALANTIAPVVAAELIRDRISNQQPFGRAKEGIAFGLGALFDGMVAASVGATIVWAQASAPLRALPGRWFEWTLSDAGGCLLLTPLFLLGPPKQPWLERIREHKTEFGVGAALSGLAVVYLLLGSTGVLAVDAGASFLLLLPLLWMAMRWSLEVAYPMLVAVIVATIAGSLAGYGPFSGVERGGVLAIFAQMAIGFGTSVLLLGGAAREQQAAKEALRKVNLDLEGRVEQRTAELRESQHQLEKAAFYDPLTGLPNRRLLQERFGSCGVAARRKGDGFVLLLLDLDHFKNVNDRLGHDTGDAVLVETACRLTTAVRDGDVVARMGGDEFAILLTETCDPVNIDRVCNRIIQKLGEPISFHNSTLNTSASIGVSLFPDHGATWQAVYKAADMALYEAKHAGRGTWRWHLPETSPVGGSTQT